MSKGDRRRITNMTIEEIKQLPDITILSLIHSATGAEYDNMVTVLKERGYRLCGFHWTKDENEKDPVEEMRKKIYRE